MCASLLFAHVLEVGTSTLKAHLHALQEAGAHPLRVVCWHFTHVLLDTEMQLLQAAGLVVYAVLAGSPKPVVQRVKIRTEEPIVFRFPWRSRSDRRAFGAAAVSLGPCAVALHLA